MRRTFLESGVSFGKLTVIVLTRNEEENIRGIIDTILGEVHNPLEILVVDDSSDRTPDIVREIALRHPDVRLVAQEGNGYTSAITTGVTYSTGRALVILVADSSDEIGDVEKMRGKLETGYDVVCASRYMRNGSRTGGNAVQGFFSAAVGRSLNFFLGIGTSDVSNSFKMYRKSVFDRLTIEDSGFATSMQITVKAFFNGEKITELPTAWMDRAAGKSKFLLIRQSRYYMYWYFWALLHGFFKLIRFWRL